jgi:DnaJ-class molecular chaperone
MITEQVDYYEVLGVESTATMAEIKDAYRRLALKYHPDKNKELGASSKFQLITKVYRILSDPFSRNKYDNFGAEAANNYDFYLYNHLFEGLFFSPDWTNLENRFGDRKIDCSRPYNVWVETNVLEFEYNRRILCSICHGSGEDIFSGCDNCKGYGYLYRIEYFKLPDVPPINIWVRFKEKGDQASYVTGDLYVKYRGQDEKKYISTKKS